MMVRGRTVGASVAANPERPDDESGGDALAAQILDGKALAKTVRGEIAEEVAVFHARTGITPGLTAVLVGDNPASAVYVRSKQKACEAAGMKGEVIRLPADTPESRLIETVD